MGSNYWFIAKVCVQVVLLAVFWKYFGLKSLQRFQDQKVLVTSYEESQVDLPAPAVTICPQNSSTKMGWLHPEKITEQTDIVGQVCRGRQQIHDCVEAETINLTSTVRGVSRGFSGEEIAGVQGWSSDFTRQDTGMCFTYTHPFNMGTIMKNESLAIYWAFDLSCMIFVHDPSFFLLNYNPALPLNSIQIVENTQVFYRMVVVQHINLDVASKPCQSDPTYSFTACIKNILSKEVGCRLYWDRLSNQTLPLCDNLEQYR